MTKIHQKGFTLIELMIVIAIIGIIAAIAIPSYQDYSVRSKISELVIAVSPIKLALSEAYTLGGTAALNQAALSFNAMPASEKSSKYISDVRITNPTSSWSISIVLAANEANGIPVELDGSTLTLSPNIQGLIPNDDSTGSIDWACASSTANRATALGLANRILGTLPARYAPSECR